MPSLDISLEPQANSDLCWAAVALAVLNHYRKYNHHFPSSQQELTAQFTRGANEQFDVFDVLQRYGVSNGTRLGFSQTDIIASIDNNEPAIIKTGTGANSHFLLVVGYRKDDIEKFQMELKDPRNPSHSFFSRPDQVRSGVKGILFTKQPPIPKKSSTRRCACPCVIL